MGNTRILKELISRPQSAWEAAVTVAECEAVIANNIAALHQWHQHNKPVMAMCAPTYYDFVDGTPVEGNGFVEAGYTAFIKDKEASLRSINADWHQFQNLLMQHGAHVVNMDPTAGMIAKIFTADPLQSYVFLKNEGDKSEELHSLSILSNFANPFRVNEVSEMVLFLDKLKHQDEYVSLFKNRITAQAKQKMEGTGDNLIDPYRGIILSGYGVRNSQASLQELEHLTGIPVFGIHSHEPFFHVDTYLSILPGGYVLYAPEVMTNEGIKQLEKAVFKNNQALKEKYAIIVSKEDAEKFVCNAVTVGDHVIMQPCSDSLRIQLEARGFSVDYTDAKVANYGGGGLHCMTNKLNQPVYYSPAYTLAQKIRNNIVDGVEIKTDEPEIQSTYQQVQAVCDDSARKIQRQFRMWRNAKKENECKPALSGLRSLSFAKLS